jgi:hypothetical protein
LRAAKETRAMMQPVDYSIWKLFSYSGNIINRRIARIGDGISASVKGWIDRPRISFRDDDHALAPAGRSAAACVCTRCARGPCSALTNDNTVRYRGRTLQIPESPLRRHFVRASVRVHDYADGTLALFHGPRCIARYAAAGAPPPAPPSRWRSNPTAPTTSIWC